MPYKNILKHSDYHLIKPTSIHYVLMYKTNKGHLKLNLDALC